jgi:hypothetical protein
MHGFCVLPEPGPPCLYGDVRQPFRGHSMSLQVTVRQASRASRREARRCYIDLVDVVLRKLGKGARAVAGRLVRAPRKGSVVVIEFPDGMHEYVTTPVKRVLRLAGREVFYIETINSRYRLEVRSREATAAEGTG